MEATDCKEIFQRVARLYARDDGSPIDVEFYPYVDLDHTIRRRNGRILVRLSDIVGDAPPQIIEALAHILLGKILRRKHHTRFTKLYRLYADSPEILAEIAHTRALRGRPSPGNEVGKHVQLAGLFANLNARYFAGHLQGIRLIWSKRRSLRRLGYYRQSFHTIVISRTLDDPRIPHYIPEFVLYHEMLHAEIQTELRTGRRLQHTAEFKEEERKFEHYEEAKRYLSRWPPTFIRKPATGPHTPRQLCLF